MSKRTLALVATLLVLGAFFSLLGWALVRTQGVPGGLGINKDFGEISIETRPAPDFTLELLDGGSSVKLSDLRGKVVMIDFWSSWCPPCREEAPGIARVYREYEGEAVEFLGISIWDKAPDARAYLREFGVTYPNGLDGKATILVEYAVRGIPEKFFIDAEGQMVRKFVGPVTAQRLREILDGMLAASS